LAPEQKARQQIDQQLTDCGWLVQRASEMNISAGRWRSFDYEELMKRDKVNLDVFWLKDKSLEDSEDLPDPDVLAQEIADDLQTALEDFSSIAEGLKE